MNNTILVTGAAGFIGFHLCKRLLALNYRVCGIDNMNSYYSVDLKRARLSELKKYESFIFFEQSVGDSKKLDSVLDEIRPSIIFHLAAQAGVRYSIENPRAYLESNIDETFNLLEAVRKLDLKHFLFASTSSAYGASREELLSEDLACQTPMSFYSATKLSCEAMCHAYSNIYDLNITAMRFFTVYGPYGREDMAYYKFLNQIKNKNKIIIYGGKNSVRSFTYIDDVVHSLILLIKNFSNKKSYNECLNIGNYYKNSLDDLIRCIKKYYTKSFKEKIISRNKSDVFRTQSSIVKLKKLIKFYPKTKLDNGMKKFISWYKLF